MARRLVLVSIMSFMFAITINLIYSWLVKRTISADVLILSGIISSLISIISVIFILEKGSLIIRLIKHWRILSLKSNIKDISMSEKLPGLLDNKVELMKLSWKFGDITDTGKLTLLCLMVKRLNARNIFEIGTFRGRTTLNLALNANDDAHVYTLDLPNPDTPVTHTTEGEKKYMATLAGGTKTGEVFMTEDVPQNLKRKISSFRCNSREFDFKPYYGTMDMVFVDGGHTYDVIESDTKHAMRMVNEKGIIVWDDYTAYWPGVKFYLDKLSLEKKLYCDSRTGLIIYSPAW